MEKTNKNSDPFGAKATLTSKAGDVSYFKLGALAEPGYHRNWRWLILAVMLCPPVIAGAFWVLYYFGCVTLPRVAPGP